MFTFIIVVVAIILLITVLKAYFQRYSERQVRMHEHITKGYIVESEIVDALPEKIGDEFLTIDLIGKDFFNTSYCNPNSCALAKALKRIFKNPPWVGVDKYRVNLNNYHYSIINGYGTLDFEHDKAIATERNFDNSIMRTIQLELK